VVAERTGLGTLPALTARQKSIVLLCASATSSLIMLDTNIVAVSLPSIAHDLHAGFGGVQWVISAYLITFAALLLPSGSLADLHGRRRVLMAGILVFLISSAVCGLATSALALELARAVQGIGGSLLLTSALAIITSTFPAAERAKAFAFWGTSLGIAITVGPIVGGVITGVFGWRWAFLINVPICVALLAAARACVPESRDPQARRLDVLGIVTLSGGLFALISALIDGNSVGWGAQSIVIRAVATAAFLTAFIAVERMQERPMLDLGLFRRRGFVGAAFGTFGYGASAQVMIFFLPIFLQGAFGLGPLIAGFAMLPFAVPLFVAPRAAAALLHGWSHRSALLLGLAITGCGNVLLGTLAHLGSYTAIAVAMLVAGVGTGMLNPETVKAMQEQIGSDRAGMASGIGATLRFISLLLGVAVLGAVMAHFAPSFAPGRELHAAQGFAAVACVAAAISLVAFAGTAIFMKPRAAGARPEMLVAERPA
jgi:EmrB/QacA subfamily drug resistance transporter